MSNAPNGLTRGPDRPDAGSPPSRTSASGPQVGSPVESDGSFQILSLKEDDGACIATVICAGFASVLRFVLDRHDEWDLGTGSDAWPVAEGSDEYWDCLGLVNDYMEESR